MKFSTSFVERTAYGFYALTGFKIYTGAPPATADAAATGTLLADFQSEIDNAIDNTFSLQGNLVTWSFMDTSGNNDFAQTSALGSGAAGYARAVIADDYWNEHIFDLTITSAGGGGDIELASTAFSGGDVVKLNGFAVTVPTGA
ncbi:MAG: hypothetical protein RBS36_05775 [Thiomicrospira sp.]|jgi:hypothetical protein|nr:hypothetical protein [Thiomicrospira sp.]